VINSVCVLLSLGMSCLTTEHKATAQSRSQRGRDDGDWAVVW